MTIPDTLALVVAICTAFYTIINLMIWVESKKTRKQKITPLIVAYLKTTEENNFICLHIKNIGEGCAKNIQIKILKDYNLFGKENAHLSNSGGIRNGVNIFPPNYELRYFIHYTQLVDFNDLDSCIKLKIDYVRLDDSKKYTQIYELPFIEIAGQSYSNPPESYMGQIPFYLKELNENVKMLKNK